MLFRELTSLRNIFLFVLVNGTSLKMTESMGLCEFEAKFPCNDGHGCSTYRCNGASAHGEHTLKTSPSDDTVQSTPNQAPVTNIPINYNLFPRRSSTTQRNNYSTADPPATDSVCAPNMVYSNCSCQGTCEDPSSCHNNCTDSKECVCPRGFLMRGDNCVPEDKCGCFIEGYGVLQKDAIFVNSTCSERCTCRDEVLSCDKDFKCDSHAVCEERDSVRNCYCKTGLEGDGRICVNASTPSDCYDIFRAGITSDGIYNVKPNGWTGTNFAVYCNMSHDGGWTVLQRRINGSEDFNRDWAVYKKGFGSLNHEFWFGNEKLFFLTNQRKHQLRIDMVSVHMVRFHMTYDLFRVDNENNSYQLTLGNYTGNAGYDYMIDYRDRPFSTFNRDDSGNCSNSHRAGWWFKNCYTANLNGNSSNGIPVCDSAHSNYQYLQYTQMKMRPVSEETQSYETM